MNKPTFILPVIIASQFLCTSLWFASNGVMQDLIKSFEIPIHAFSYLTSAVQLGFIIGTLLFAILSISDRYSPSKVFLMCAILGATLNLGIVFEFNTLFTLITFRFFTGFFLAGIYPVGMKIAADYFDKGLGKSLGFLVGALVLGTAFPHLLKEFKGNFSWEFVIITTSCLAILGGFMMWFFVPDGPYRKTSQKIQLKAIRQVFKKQDFREAAYGYFGHMWELYTFWAFIPIVLNTYSELHPSFHINSSLYSFFIISIGSISCIASGFLAQKVGEKKLSYIILFMSFCCCIVVPVAILYINSGVLFIAFLLFWGAVVIADSPLFSTLIAKNAPVYLKGTALTIVNSIGFLITILSIQLLNMMRNMTESVWLFSILAIGPLLALFSILKKYFLKVIFQTKRK